MRTRKLGNSDLVVSELGLGAMSLGKDAQKASSIIDEALHHGVNYIDTADLYDMGENEELIGKAISKRRKDIILATKAGNRFEQGKEGWEWDPSKKHIQQAVKDSLLRLKTDYIDLYQLHGGTIDDPIDETIEAFEELKQEGVIREYGISSIRPNVIREYVKKSSIVSVMMQHSLVDRRAEEWFELLDKNKISVVTRGPIAKGILSDRPLDSIQSVSDKGYMNYTYAELDTLRQQLNEHFSQKRSLVDVAFQYNLAQTPVASVIAGASSIEQIRENAQAIQSQPLSSEEISWLKQHTKADVYEQHR
ncbi:aldo/keto reductase [Alkalicoccobacillus murimartini]|uniref:Aryl-alcohol dehydrogenase-like predicted oxidoreductase n=1 Tax=Alkalicoccobacillus murimartini TaxID=171685 RepID=A0ABT9YJG0_9BACI|nr:aldo/keto reductase [Alkalicoccobacillus murimartini]MDQ0207996.1 aryl-alcohol dehydrogenase-like predicted oxidoreductase [Alkalicoccobacillus murimartini]